jgi:hypothetical protein
MNYELLTNFRYSNFFFSNENEPELTSLVLGTQEMQFAKMVL